MKSYNLPYIKSILLTLILLLAGCSDNVGNLNLRSNENDLYYWENNKEASQRLAKIMYNDKSDQKTERFKIVHISDSHISTGSPSNNKKLPINLIQSVRFANQEELRINAMVATGDFISHDKKSEAKDCMSSFVYNLFNNNLIPTFICVGNHDSNSREIIDETFLYRNEINTLLFGRNSYSLKRDNSENYYYSDVPNPQGGTIRFIALDMLDQPAAKYNSMIYAIYSQKQIDWLSNVALKEDMTESHSIIILTHYPFQPHNGSYLCDGDYVHEWNMIPEIIEAFRTRESINKVYSNKLGEEPINVKADFKDSRGEFICHLGGHIHCNAYFDIKGLSNASDNLPPQRMILCTNQSPSETGTIYNRVERNEDSLSSNSFCIHAIDTKEKKIYITFFGAFKPVNDSNYPEIHTLNYL